MLLQSFCLFTSTCIDKRSVCSIWSIDSIGVDRQRNIFYSYEKLTYKKEKKKKKKDSVLVRKLVFPRIIEYPELQRIQRSSSCWSHIGLPKNYTVHLKTLSKHFLNFSSLDAMTWSSDHLSLSEELFPNAQSEPSLNHLHICHQSSKTSVSLLPFMRKQ